MEVVFDEKFNLESIGIYSDDKFVFLAQDRSIGSSLMEQYYEQHSLVCPKESLSKLIEALQKLC